MQQCRTCRERYYGNPVACPHCRRLFDAAERKAARHAELRWWMVTGGLGITSLAMVIMLARSAQ